MPPLVPRVSLIVGHLALQCPNLLTTLIQFRLGAATQRRDDRTRPVVPVVHHEGADGHPGAMAARPIAMFPLSTVLFPHARMPLHVFEPRYRRLVADCLAGDGLFGVVLIARGSEVGGGDQRVGVGTVAPIEAAEPLADGRWYLVVVGLGLVRVTRWLEDDPYPRAVVEDVAVAASEDECGAASAPRPSSDASGRLLSELGEAPAMLRRTVARRHTRRGRVAVCARWRPSTSSIASDSSRRRAPSARLALLVELAARRRRRPRTNPGRRLTPRRSGRRGVSRAR